MLVGLKETGVFNRCGRLRTENTEEKEEEEWRDRRVLALLLSTRRAPRSACVGHVTSRPTVSQSECHRGFLSGLFKRALRQLPWYTDGLLIHAPNHTSCLYDL